MCAAARPLRVTRSAAVMENVAPGACWGMARPAGRRYSRLRESALFVVEKAAVYIRRPGNTSPRVPERPWPCLPFSGSSGFGTRWKTAWDDGWPNEINGQMGREHGRPPGGAAVAACHDFHREITETVDHGKAVIDVGLLCGDLCQAAGGAILWAHCAGTSRDRRQCVQSR